MFLRHLNDTIILARNAVDTPEMGTKKPVSACRRFVELPT